MVLLYCIINLYKTFLANNVPTITLPEDPSIVNGTLQVQVGVQTNITLNGTDPDGDTLSYFLDNDPSIQQPDGVMIDNGKKFVFQRIV